MAHAVPASGGRSGRSGRSGRHGGHGRHGPDSAPDRPAGTSADVFGPRVHRAVRWALPLALGLVYGYWAAANRRGGGPVTGWNILFGFVTALVFMALYVAVRALAPRLSTGPHALLWGLFAGAALGFLVSQSDGTWLYSTGLGLLTTVTLTATLYYRLTMHEDAEAARRARESAAAGPDTPTGDLVRRRTSPAA